jgi:hypothetical protein
LPATDTGAAAAAAHRHSTRKEARARGCGLMTALPVAK